MTVGRIPVGVQDGKKMVAAVVDRGNTWPNIVKHAQANGPFTSPDHLRQVFPTAKFTVELAQMRT